MVGTTYAPKPYDEEKTEKLGITLHLSRLQKIDKMRGDVPHTKFIRRSLETF
ncbi:MAG TPA: hypothetical protein VJ729_06345 [Nitrososphaeraceae archaeon]|jgi:hypothetical protein|nr:hypothetical protein [Nitrososphaeraceae archaeon]